MTPKLQEIKAELEKVSKIIPELRHELDEVYASGPGKKSRMKLLWHQFEDRYNKVKNSPEYTKLQ